MSTAGTRQRLLDATALVLSRQGFAGTRLSDIAREAQVQAPAVYHWFASREDLIEEVMYVGAAGMHRHLVQCLAGAGGGPAERIAVAVEAHLRHQLELSHYSTAMIRNANQVPPAVSRRALAEVAAYNDVWRQLVAELAQAGQLRPGLEPAAARMLVLGALNWTAEWVDPGRGPIDDVVRAAQSFVLHALVP